MFHVITQALSGTCVVNFNWIIINNNNSNNKIMKKKLPKKNFKKKFIFNRIRMESVERNRISF